MPQILNCNRRRENRRKPNIICIRFVVNHCCLDMYLFYSLTSFKTKWEFVLQINNQLHVMRRRFQLLPVVDLMHTTVQSEYPLNWDAKYGKTNQSCIKMIVLEKFKFFQNILGLDPRGGLKNIIVRVIYWIILFSCELACLMFFLINLHEDMFQSMAVMPVVSVFISHVAIYSYLLVNRRNLNSLLDELQEIVNESTKIKLCFGNNANCCIRFRLIVYICWLGANKVENEMIYTRAELRINFVMKIIYFGYVPIPMVSLSPFVVAAYHWCLGNYTLDSWFFFLPIW